MSEMQDRVMRAIDEALFTEGVVITFSERVTRAAINALREPTDEMGGSEEDRMIWSVTIDRILEND